MQASQDLQGYDIGGPMVNGAQVYAYDKTGDYLRGADDPNGEMIGGYGVGVICGSSGEADMEMMLPMDLVALTQDSGFQPL